MRSRALALAAALAAAPLLAGTARADETSQNFDAQSWKPALDPYGYATVEGAQSLSLLSMHAQTYFNWAEDPLRVVEPRLDGSGSRPIIDRLLMMDMCFAVGVLPEMLLGEGTGLTVGVDLPVALYEKGYDLEGSDHLPTAGWGDLRLGAKLTIFGRDDSALGLAVTGGLELPTGSERMFLSSGHDQLVPSCGIVLEKRLLVFRVAANIGYEVQPLELGIPGAQVDDKLKLSGGLCCEPFEALGIPLLKSLGAFAEVIHWTRAEHPWKNPAESPAEAGLGVRLTQSFIGVLAGVNVRVNDGVGAPNERFYVSISLFF